MRSVYASLAAVVTDALNWVGCKIAKALVGVYAQGLRVAVDSAERADRAS